MTRRYLSTSAVIFMMAADSGNTTERMRQRMSQYILLITCIFRRGSQVAGY